MGNLEEFIISVVISTTILICVLIFRTIEVAIMGSLTCFILALVFIFIEIKRYKKKQMKS